MSHVSRYAYKCSKSPKSKHSRQEHKNGHSQ